MGINHFQTSHQWQEHFFVKEIARGLYNVKWISTEWVWVRVLGLGVGGILEPRLPASPSSPGLQEDKFHLPRQGLQNASRKQCKYPSIGAGVRYPSNGILLSSEK